MGGLLKEESFIFRIPSQVTGSTLVATVFSLIGFYQVRIVK